VPITDALEGLVVTIAQEDWGRAGRL